MSVELASPHNLDVTRRTPLQTLFIDDDSSLARALMARLDPATFNVRRVSLNDADDATLEMLCGECDAAVVASAGWDPVAARRVSSSLDALIGGLRGSGKRLLYLSDATVIGDTGDSFGNEDNPRSTNDPHAWHARAEEQLARAATTGVRPIIIRPALVHGAHSGALLERLVEHATSTGEAVYVGDGAARISTVHIDDLAAMIGLALRRAPRHSVYLAASSEVLTWRDIAAVVAASTSPPSHVASITAKVAGRVGLDAPTMTMNCVIRDDSPHRGLGWVAHGPTLGPPPVSS